MDRLACNVNERPMQWAEPVSWYGIWYTSTLAPSAQEKELWISIKLLRIKNQKVELRTLGINELSRRVE